jgi:hypothetical protein
VIEDGAWTVAFAVFGIGSQVVLVAYFAARRWSPRIGRRFGWLAYAFAGLGLPLGVWLLFSGQSWRLYVGPILLALWATLGAVVDLWRRVEWRPTLSARPGDDLRTRTAVDLRRGVGQRTPIRWSVFIPYVALYFWAQMFLWWPLWHVNRAAWALFLVLFVANTALNLPGHFVED